MKRALATLTGGLSLAAALIPGGCTTVAQVGMIAGQATGVITADQAASINRTAAAVEKTYQDITPEQEYYIGRSVAATVLQTYKPYDAEALNRYLNELGQSLALYSDRPETFGGYHFLTLETDEVNAFAAPGGLILVSRGLLRCCRSEDALAAVLAHEIGHVQNQHGLKAIKAGRYTSAGMTAVMEAGKSLTGGALSEAVKTFEGSVSDVASTLMNSGYSRGQEKEADAAAIQILSRAGYDPHALVDLLRQMAPRLAADARGFGKTHPSPDTRIQSVSELLKDGTVAPAPGERQRRFAVAIALAQ